MTSYTITTNNNHYCFERGIRTVFHLKGLRIGLLYHPLIMAYVFIFYQRQYLKKCLYFHLQYISFPNFSVWCKWIPLTLYYFSKFLKLTKCKCKHLMGAFFLHVLIFVPKFDVHASCRWSINLISIRIMWKICW